MKNINEIFINQHATIKETMKIIDQGGARIALVVDESNKLIGLVTDGDIRRGILKGIDIEEKVFEVMNKNPVYLSFDAPKEKIMFEIIKNPVINGIPLVDKNKVVKDLALLLKGNKLSYFNSHSKSKTQLNRILVIGGGGYIGSVLAKKLLDKGYKVNILDKFFYGKESVKEIKDNPNIKIMEGDTRHIEDVTAAIQDADAVAHLAELVGDPACALDPSTTQEINYMATRIVASICKHFQINRLVYGSSCSVYGASKENNLLSEISPINPISLYAKMKIASEKALLEMKDENFLPTILRLSTVFGFSYRPRFDLVVNTLTAKAVRENKITIFGGDQYRPNVHVADVADAIISSLEAPIEIVGGEVINVGSEENNYTINRLGEIVKEVIPSAELVIEEREVDKRDYKVDFSKLRRKLNIEMKKSVKDGINEIKEVLEKNKDINHEDKKYSNIKFLEENNNFSTNTIF